jgi:DNA-binding MarR family transcriptional regulator
MPTPFDHLAEINRLVHDPSRLAILTALAACEKADFIFLLNVTRLTKGNLSSHLSKLQQGGLVVIEKTFAGKQPVTYVMLTPEGREGLDEHWKRLEAIRRGARTWRPARSSG